MPYPVPSCRAVMNRRCIPSCNATVTTISVTCSTWSANCWCPAIVSLPARGRWPAVRRASHRNSTARAGFISTRSEEHTSELQSRENLVCRLLLEKKKTLIDLTVQHLAPHVPISVVIHAADYELLAHPAGADNVMKHVRFTGFVLIGHADVVHIPD